MALDALAATYAFGAGAASFFSPCSVGLLPAYVGYFLSSNTAPAQTGRPWFRGMLNGLTLGMGAAGGFFIVLVAAAILVALIPFRALTPALPYVSILIGLAIVALGLLYAMGRGPRFTLPARLTERRTSSVFAFGVAYALASLGCTFPLFLSVVLGGASTGSPLWSAVSVLVFALGMSLVMVIITTALAISEGGARRFLRNATPLVSKASAVLMIAAGLYVIYYWLLVIQSS